MRTITKQSVNAFLSGQKFSTSNTTVTVEEAFAGVNEIVKLHLFGNVIATKIKESNLLLITNCGWKTKTTKERLNALPNVNITQKAGTWYLNGEEWDGQPKAIEIN